MVRKILREESPAEWRLSEKRRRLRRFPFPLNPFSSPQPPTRYDLLQIFGKISSSFLIKGAPIGHFACRNVVNFMSAEFESNGVDYLTILKGYKAKGLIEQTSPHWWSTDYAPDPREYLPFEQFQKRLVYLGEIPTRKAWRFAISAGMRELPDDREAYVYRGAHVPR
ncbi:MAG: hypothetical protein M1575_01095 [Patescibacteria group bacterium]|nr:hypothetical protein [Patescibacteria group bacterium]MCL5095315.1 hypothetical protein [Patescibacteria group bacterium]